MLRNFKIVGIVFVMALVFWGPAAVASEPSQGVPQPDLVSASSAVQLSQDEEDANDPLEGLNRTIFNINEGIQDGVLRPIANAYNASVPENGRQALKNVFDNLSEPINFVNNILQFEFERATNTLVRVMVNTVFGAAGIMDIAGDMGLNEQSEDFGQTLAVWGVGEGFYLVLPILGPSNPRDAVGRLVIDSYFDPLGRYLDNTEQDEIDLALDLVDGLVEFADVVEELDQIKKTSVDYYAAIRSLYRQKRRAEISNGENIDLPPIPDLAPEFRGEYLAPPNDEGPVASLQSVSN